MKAPEDREDFYFQEKSEKDFELEDMMETLQGMGGGMGGMGKLKSVVFSVVTSYSACLFCSFFFFLYFCSRIDLRFLFVCVVFSKQEKN